MQRAASSPRRTQTLRKLVRGYARKATTGPPGRRLGAKGRQPPGKGTATGTGPGFTLIELLAVIVLLGVLAVAGLVRYWGMQDQSRRQAATALAAKAQSQLSLEYSFRLVSGLALDVEPQTVCDRVAIGSLDTVTAGLVCAGTLTGTVTITGTVDGVSAPDVTWTSPQSGE